MILADERRKKSNKSSVAEDLLQTESRSLHGETDSVEGRPWPVLQGMSVDRVGGRWRNPVYISTRDAARYLPRVVREENLGSGEVSDDSIEPQAVSEPNKKIK